MQADVTADALLTFTQIPHPMQSSSEIQAILAVEDTSIHSLPAQSSLLTRQAQPDLRRTLRAVRQAGLRLQVTMASHLFSPQDSSFCILAGTSLAYTCATKEHLMLISAYACTLLSARTRPLCYAGGTAVMRHASCTANM